VGHPTLGLRDAEPIEERREPDPVLGLVDGVEIGSEEGTPSSASGPARLSGVWPPNATTAGRRGSPGAVSASTTSRTDSGSSGSK
jgi:hypothetical protein